MVQYETLLEKRLYVSELRFLDLLSYLAISFSRRKELGLWLDACQVATKESRN